MKTIQTNQGKFVAVCDCHYDLVKDYKWTYFRTYHRRINEYFKRMENGRTILMHRVIASTPEDLVADHKDGNGLNNTCINIRNVTKHQNNMNKGIQSNNKSGVSGVRFREDRGKWIAQIQVSGKNIRIGTFDNEKDAILKRREAEKHYFGQFARSI